MKTSVYLKKITFWIQIKNEKSIIFPREKYMRKCHTSYENYETLSELYLKYKLVLTWKSFLSHVQKHFDIPFSNILFTFIK